MDNTDNRQETGHEPVFLTIDEVVRIHEDQTGRYGGIGDILDWGLLESAVAQPCAGLGDEYLHKTIFEMAAAYLYHIAMNHPFADGNKRVGAMAAYVFLALNGCELDADEAKFEDLVRMTASGKAEKAEIAGFLEEHSTRSAD